MSIDPRISWTDTGARVEYDGLPVVLVYDHITEAGPGVQAELTVEAPDGDSVLFGPAQVGLLSVRDLRDVARQLNELCSPGGDEDDWAPLLISAGHLVVRHWRSQDRVVELSSLPLEDPRWLVHGVIPEGQIVLWTADGASGKSWLALAMAVSVASGSPVICDRLTPQEPGAVLYLDYETDAATQRHRLARIMQGCGCAPTDSVPGLYYLQGLRPLCHVEHEICRVMQRTGARLLIIDTLALAAGGDAGSSESAIRFMLALRRLPGAKLLLAHVSKSSRDKPAQERTVFGSVFFRNIARGEWAIHGVQDEGDDELRLVMQDVKRNMSGRQEPLGIRIRFGVSGVVFEEVPPEFDADLAEHISIPRRIVSLLRNFPQGLNTGQLSEELCVDGDSVRVALKRLKDKGVVLRTGSDSSPIWVLNVED